MEQDLRAMAQVTKRQTLSNVVSQSIMVIERFEKLQELSDEMYFKFNRKPIDRKLDAEEPAINQMSVIDALDYCNRRLISLSDFIADGIINVSESIE